MEGSPHVDRAKWRRFSSGNKDRCEICGGPAQVSITVSAQELGGRTGTMIAKRQLRFCDTHGQARMARAIDGLLGTVTKAS